MKSLCFPIVFFVSIFLQAGLPLWAQDQAQPTSASEQVQEPSPMMKALLFQAAADWYSSERKNSWRDVDPDRELLPLIKEINKGMQGFRKKQWGNYSLPDSLDGQVKSLILKQSGAATQKPYEAINLAWQCSTVSDLQDWCSHQMDSVETKSGATNPLFSDKNGQQEWINTLSSLQDILGAPESKSFTQYSNLEKTGISVIWLKFQGILNIWFETMQIPQKSGGFNLGVARLEYVIEMVENPISKNLDLSLSFLRADFAIQNWGQPLDQVLFLQMDSLPSLSLVPDRNGFDSSMADEKLGSPGGHGNGWLKSRPGQLGCRLGFLKIEAEGLLSGAKYLEGQPPSTRKSRNLSGDSFSNLLGNYGRDVRSGNGNSGLGIQRRLRKSTESAPELLFQEKLYLAYLKAMVANRYLVFLQN